MTLAALLVAALPLVAQQVYLVPDSSGYVAIVHSLVWDRDVDCSNEFARLGMIDREGAIAFGERTRAGRPGNPFGIGSALLWTPMVAATALAASIAARSGARVATDGFGTSTLVAVQLGTWTCGLAALALVAALLAELFPAVPERHRRLALAGALLGTPFLYYMVQMPTYSHVPAAFAAALVLWLAVRWRAAWSSSRALALGAAVGLAGTIRVQDGAALLVLPLLVGRWGGALRSPGRPRLLAAYSLGLGIAAAPQLLAWQAIYGTLVRVPQGAGFLHLEPLVFLQVLLASRHGLLAWSPVVALALAGACLLLRDPETRGLALALLLAGILEWIANALPIDWWAGWSFGARRFTSCAPLVAVGLAAAAARGRVLRGAIAVTTALGCVQWLRVATRNLSGDADPGWGMLWGTGFWGFLTHVPAALADLVAAPSTELQVLRRPGAPTPQLGVDARGFEVGLALAWAAVILIVAGWLGRRTAGRNGA